jgi:acyl dehydratase
MLQVDSEVMEITPSRSRPNRGTVVVHSRTRNQRDEVVQALTAKAHRSAARVIGDLGALMRAPEIATFA